MQVYGHMPNGDDVFQVSIESDDLKLKVLSLGAIIQDCLLYTSPSPRDGLLSRMPSSA